MYFKHWDSESDFAKKKKNQTFVPKELPNNWKNQLEMFPNNIY